MNLQRPPIGQLLLYSLGHFGYSLAAFGAANLLVYFYVPAETAEGSVFPSYIYQGAILGIATLVGLLNFGGRVFDAVTDPLIAAWADRVQSRYGRRRKLMGMAAVPYAVLSLLIFCPPSTDVGLVNSIWLAATVLIFYLFLTLYIIPYTALISELGHHPDDRMRISTFVSVTWAMGFLVGSTAYALQGIFEPVYGPVLAFQIVMGLFAAVSLLFMLVPVFFLREQQYAYQKSGRISTAASMRAVFANRNFRPFIASDLLYWLSLTFIQLGVGYYVLILFQFNKAQATVFLGIGFICSFLLYVPVNLLVKRYGKKLIVQIAFVAFALIFLALSGMEWLPLPKRLLFYGMAVLSAFPLAAFGIIPNAITADIIYEQEAATGQQQAAMFYAVRTFMMKLGVSLANFIFPSLLLLGKSVEEPLGVKLSAVCAFLFCITGLLIFSLYREQVIPSPHDAS